ncbi:MAG TPA: pilus assembly protein PilP [Gammaproteobacteria bacterium]|nr:pilus assembly protein PilP [Pseudomonadota bacterium]HBF07046.1 pilus assembly protein PilP [Gammaproteobacteria bacterium]HCK93293.1 pilus assembly protein PilP [Gammaproteobacteria bacterium]|tara:strand:- start:671 stop:1207 length:537 start_codon:yes stop_codon:yes gene_type:complete
MKNAFKFIAAGVCLMTFAGCAPSDPTADLRVELERIRNMEGAPIDPPPEFRVFDSYVYSSSNLRSPFMPQIRVADKPKNVPQGRSVTPDFDRPKEPLEDFGMDQLEMVGTIQRPDGPLIALVKDDMKGVHQIKVGSYMGRNHGKVLLVNESQIDLLELVPDGRDSWIERPRTMWLTDE